MSREYIFTDVHGCIDELEELYRLVNPSSDDTIISAGDLVDRGPASAEVVRFFSLLRKRHRVELVEGNHCYKHRRFRKNLSERPKVARDMARSKPELEMITTQLSDEDISFLNGSKLYLTLPHRNTTVLHGGVTPTMHCLPRNPEGWSKHDVMLMYVRYVDPSGGMVRLGAERPDCKFWADLYDGRFGHIIFGHEPFIDSPAPVEFGSATGLDLGCVFGGRLACAVLSDGGREYASVPARMAYSSRRMASVE